MDYNDILKVSMQKNDAGVNTIGQYLGKLLQDLWDEGEGFSSKRPFGNSGWQYELYTALVASGHVVGFIGDDGYLDSVDVDDAHKVVKDAIKDVIASWA